MSKFFSIPTWKTLSIKHWRIAVAVIVTFYFWYTGDYWREWFGEVIGTSRPLD